MKQYKYTTSCSITPDGEILNTEKTHGEATPPEDCYISPSDPEYDRVMSASDDTYNIEVTYLDVGDT